MPALQIMEAERLREVSGYAAPFTRVLEGSARSRVFFPDGFGQFVVHAQVERGSVLGWQEHHGDEGVYVAEGEIVADGAHISSGGAVVVESDVPIRIDVVRDANLVHVGTTVPGPVADSTIGAPVSSEHGLHVHQRELAPTRTFELAPLEYNGTMYEDVVHTAWFADATCPKCRIVLFRTWGPGPHRSGITHSHSVDELIVMTAGEIQFEGKPLAAGTTLAIPADLRYTFDTTMEWEFLNYRPDASYVTRNPAEAPIFDQV
jgi:hypothetical protein